MLVLSPFVLLKMCAFLVITPVCVWGEPQPALAVAINHSPTPDTPFPDTERVAGLLRLQHHVHNNKARSLSGKASNHQCGASPHPPGNETEGRKREWEINTEDKARGLGRSQMCLGMYALATEEVAVGSTACCRDCGWGQKGRWWGGRGSLKRTDSPRPHPQRHTKKKREKHYGTIAMTVRGGSRQWQVWDHPLAENQYTMDSTVQEWAQPLAKCTPWDRMTFNFLWRLARKASTQKAHHHCCHESHRPHHHCHHHHH